MLTQIHSHYIGYPFTCGRTKEMIRLSQIMLDPDHQMRGIKWLYFLCTDFHISAQWSMFPDESCIIIYMMSVYHVLDNIPTQTSTRQYGFWKHAYLLSVVFTPSTDWSVPAVGERVHCKPAACLWVPPHWFFLMADVRETLHENSSKRMPANWISSPFVGCRCKWMLIDNGTTEAKMTNPQHNHRSTTLTELCQQGVHVNRK